MKYPSCYSFPDKLVFVGEDEYGNKREVNYYRSDAYIRISGKVEDIIKLNERQKDFAEGIELPTEDEQNG